MSEARYTAEDLTPVVQQNARGISEGDIVAVPGGELHLVGPWNRRTEQAELEPLGIQRGMLDKAIRDFQKFAGKRADRVLRFPSQTLEGAAWKLGTLCGVLYEAEMEDGKKLFFHPFKKSARPTLAVLHNGRVLATLGGAFRVGERGIVDD